MSEKEAGYGEYQSEKKSKRQTNGGERKAFWAVIAILAALIVFVVLTIIQRNMVNAGEKAGVVVAAREVPAGILLTQESIQQYFTIENRLKAEVPQDSFSSGYEMVGLITGRKLSEKEIVTANSLKDIDPYEGIEDPVELSIDVDKLSHAVSGTLRAGDLVDIKVVVDMSFLQMDSYLDGAESMSLKDMPGLTDDEAGEQKEQYVFEGEGIDTLAWRERSSFEGPMAWSATGKYACVTVAENVRVVNVYTAAGEDTAKVEVSSGNQIATVFTVAVPRSMQDLLYLALEDGTLQIARIVPDTEAEQEEEKPVQDAPEEASADDQVE